MNPHPRPLPQVLRERGKIGSRFITHKFDPHPSVPLGSGSDAAEEATGAPSAAKGQAPL